MLTSFAFLAQPANPASALTQINPAGPPGAAGQPGTPGANGRDGAAGATTVSGLTDATIPFKALNVPDVAVQRKNMGAAAGADVAGLAQATLDAVNGKVDRARTTVSDAAYTITASDVYVAMTALTAGRVWTLPSASSYPVGQPLYIADESGACSSTLLITIAAAGSDTIAGQASIAMGSAYQKLAFHSNGSNLWTVA